MTELPRKIWVALFSQSGSELVAICEKLGRLPDAVLTNNLKRDFSESPFAELIRQYDTESLFNVLHQVGDFYGEEEQHVVITLHGFLRILPEDICSRFEIYNGHPAPIHLYPELKGKDKQEDLYKYKDKYPRIGCVIHYVTPGVDEGEIIISVDEPNNLTSIEDAYQTLKILSFNSWMQFFNDYLPDTVSTR